MLVVWKSDRYSVKHTSEILGRLDLRSFGHFGMKRREGMRKDGGVVVMMGRRRG